MPVEVWGPAGFPSQQGPRYITQLLVILPRDRAYAAAGGGRAMSIWTEHDEKVHRGRWERKHPDGDPPFEEFMRAERAKWDKVHKDRREAGEEFKREQKAEDEKREADEEAKRKAGQTSSSKPGSVEQVSDEGNAQRLAARHGARFRRVSDMKRWHHWDGAQWRLDHENREAREAAKDTAKQLPETDKDRRRFKFNALSSAGITSALRMAETLPQLCVTANQLDSHPELLNTPDGVVDLRTGAVTPHDSALLLTRITAYGVDLDAPHPRWFRFLLETFGADLELISYMQRMAGLALLGFIPEHVLPFLWGTGANGKGVFTLVLQGLLGDADQGGYAVSAPDGFLMTGRDGMHPTEIARLRGARLVVCSEQTSGRRFDEAKVKWLTGGDRLTGRFMHGDFFDFDPSHLLWVMSNHLPAVKEGGPAFWRRVRRIPFLHVVPEGQRNPELHSQLLADEGPAILGWAVRGAIDVLANGLRDPAAVLAATEDYRISEDTLASFVRDECLRGAHWWCAVPDFRHRYEKHCEEMSVEPLSARAVTMRLVSEFGVESDRQASRRLYRNIALQGEEERTAGDDG